MTNDTEKMLTDAIINLGIGMENLQKEMKGIRLTLEEVNKRLDRLEKQQAKTNLALGEMRLSYMKLNERVEKLNKDINERINILTERVDHLNDSFNKYAQRNDERVEEHETRISRLEEHNFGSPMLAKEPRAIYKKAKKKKVNFHD